MQPKIYISGPITGLTYATAYDNFKKVENKLVQMGALEVSNPMELFDPTAKPGELMKLRLEEQKTCQLCKPQY